jgi:zinc D-Ala-D-Ala carboxypeptidase
MIIPERISKHLTARECFKSPTAIANGIKNEPTEEHLANIKEIATQVFDKVRDNFNKPLGVTSVYRSALLNSKIRGSASKSPHMTGNAIDIDADIYGGITNKEVFEFIRDNLEYDTLIWEYGDENNPAWVHVSFFKGKNRKRILKAIHGKDGEPEYITIK